MIKNIRIPNEILDCLNLFRGVDMTLSEIIRRGIRKWVRSKKPKILKGSKKKRRGKSVPVALDMPEPMILEVEALDRDFTTNLIGILDWCIKQYPTVSYTMPSETVINEQRYLEQCNNEFHKLQCDCVTATY